MTIHFHLTPWKKPIVEPRNYRRGSFRSSASFTKERITPGIAFEPSKSAFWLGFLVVFGWLWIHHMVRTLLIDVLRRRRLFAIPGSIFSRAGFWIERTDMPSFKLSLLRCCSGK